MKITKENIKMEVSNILNQEAHSDFYTQCMDRMNHNVTIQLDGFGT